MKPYTLPEILRIADNATYKEEEAQSFKALCDHYCEKHPFFEHRDAAYWMAMKAYSFGRAIGIREERERRKKK